MSQFRQLAVGILIALCSASRLPGQNSESVEVFWKQSIVVPAAAVTRVIVFDEGICHVQVLPDRLRITGLARGETLLFVWTGETRRTLLVRVANKDNQTVAPTLLRRNESTRITGFVSSAVSRNRGENDLDHRALANRFSWQESLGTGKLLIHADTMSTNSAYTGKFNLTTGAVEYFQPKVRWAFLDSILSLKSSDEVSSSPVSSITSLMIRGVQYSRESGRHQYTVFGGITLPPRFLDLTGSSSLAGFRLETKLRPNLLLYLTQAFTSTSRSYFGQTGGGGQPGIFQMTGLVARLSPHTRVSLTGGGSNRGFLADSSVNFETGRNAAWISARYASTDFPLHHLHVLSSGKISVAAGGHKLIGDRFDTSFLMQRTSTGTNPYIRLVSGTDYVQGSASFILSSAQRFTGSYLITRTWGLNGQVGSSISRRTTADLFTRLGNRVSNSFRVAAGGLRDPFLLNSQAELSVRDTLSFRLSSFALLTAQLSQDRSDPSIANRLSQNLSLLTPAMQDYFMRDPSGFVGSPALPDSIRALLSNLQPGNRQATAEMHWNLGRRLTLATSFGHFQAQEIALQRTRTRLYGFNMNAELTAGLHLVSALSETCLYAPGGLRRVSTWSIGLTKNLNHNGRGLHDLGSSRGTVTGRVFRDVNSSGTFNQGEPGFSGIRVYLQNGQSAITDKEGRFRFPGLRPGAWTVTMTLNQFARTVRVTTPTEATVDLFESRVQEVNFGVIDYSRVRGAVFNDYLITGNRQPDAPAVAGVRLHLRNASVQYETKSLRDGEFEFDNIEPGEYVLMVDTATLPESYEYLRAAIPVRVFAARTTSQDVPVVALRSIAGRVVFRDKAVEAAVAVPLPGVTVTVGGATAVTDTNGEFLLRRLPAGQLVLTLLPRLPLPAGKRAPSGVLRLGKEPSEGKGVSVVLADSDLALCFGDLPGIPAGIFRSSSLKP